MTLKCRVVIFDLILENPGRYGYVIVSLQLLNITVWELVCKSTLQSTELTFLICMFGKSDSFQVVVH